MALALAWAAAGAAGAPAQDLDRLAAGATTVRLAYPAAANVCGTGDGILIRGLDGSTTFVSGHLSTHDWRAWRVGALPCETGDVVVRMTRDGDGDGWTSVDVAVRAEPPAPGPAGAVEDLGYVTGQAAADFLLSAVRGSGPRPARRLLLAAAIADAAETWPALLEIARDRALPPRTRRSALHWLGRQAAREAVEALGGIVRDRTEDDRIREAAVFALSQVPDDQAVPILIDVVRTMDDDPRVVDRALFWLAEFDDPRVMALFEEILSPTR